MDYYSILNQIEKSYSYKEYKSKVEELIDTNSCSGNEQSVEKIGFTRLNAYRTNRMNKQFTVNEELESNLKNLHGDLIWIVLVESWCGDAAQCLPAIEKIAGSASNVELKIIFRDEHPEIMSKYLTNGGKAIPKLICFDKNSGEEVGTWGPRPINIQKMVLGYKENYPQATHDDFITNLHLWYGRDRGRSILFDFIQLINQWSKKRQHTTDYAPVMS